MEDGFNSDDPNVRAAKLIERLQQFEGARCPQLGRPVTPQEGLMSIALGHREEAMSIEALAQSLGHPAADVWQQTLEYIQSRPCYRQAWEWAEKREGSNVVGPAAVPSAVDREGSAPSAHEPAANQTWDAGNMGCGELVMELRMRLSVMKPGAILKVIAGDPGAPEDMPSWCRLTGHKLVAMRHPEYWIQRKE